MSINRAGKQLELVLLDIGNWERWAAAKGVGNSTDIEASMVKQLDIDEAEAKKERFAYVVVGWNSTRSVESGVVEFQLSGKRKLPCSNRFLFVSGALGKTIWVEVSSDSGQRQRPVRQAKLVHAAEEAAAPTVHAAELLCTVRQGGIRHGSD